MEIYTSQNVEWDICYLCNKLVYLGIEHLLMGESHIYNELKYKFITERFSNITFNGEYWGIY